MTFTGTLEELKMAVRITACDIVLFAINTGELYETHKTMARANASIGEWYTHVGSILNLYTRQVEPCWSPSIFKNEAANELKTYYERHVEDIEDTP